MKKLMLIMVLVASFTCFSSTAQTNEGEKYGRTLNLGLGIGYYGSAHGYDRDYDGYHRSSPVFHANFEIDAARNFTLAPFISFYSYNRNYEWKDRYYYYRETVMPIGLKGTYYFDQFLQAGSKWDFYLAGSLGFAYRRVIWEDGYGGHRYSHGRPLYLDLHLGAEYHLNSKLGLFLDLSSGVSTFGLAFHF